MAFDGDLLPGPIAAGLAGRVTLVDDLPLDDIVLARCGLAPGRAGIPAGGSSTGGLGLLLGSVGLGVVVLRNVLERRGELALLLAVLSINQFWQQAIVGGLILLAIGADRLVAVRVAASLRKRGSHVAP